MNLEGSLLKRKEDTLPRISGLSSAVRSVAHGLADGLKPPPPADYLEWAQKNVIFSAEHQFPGPYNPERFPFYTDILRALQPDSPVRDIVLKKSAQVGGTIIGQVFIGASMDTDPGGFLVVHPTIDNARRWANQKWKEFVEKSAALIRLFRSSKTRDTKNSTFFKERVDGRGWLQISGANSPASLSMMTVKKQIQDDLDKWENNDAGDPENQADSRSQAHEFDAKILKVSTPLIKGISRISNAYNRSNQQLFHVPCPSCGHMHALEWENFKQSLHEGMNTAEAHFTCPANGCVIEHHHKADMVSKGRWVAKNPKSAIAGFYIWSAYSPLMSWKRLADEYFKAKDNPEAEQNFYNDKLGLEYEQKGDAPPWEEIRDRAKSSDYVTGRIPQGALLLCMGVDVQGDRIEWLLKGFGPNLQRWTIQRGVIDGCISERDTWGKLDMLLKREWVNKFGRRLKIDAMAIDGNFEKNDVFDWAKRHPESRVIIVRGVGSHHAPPIVLQQDVKDRNGKTMKNQKRFFNVGVSPMKASLYKHLTKIDPQARGYCAFPNDLDDDYFVQLCSETRLIETKSNGATEMVWKRINGVRNEVLDMENYAEAAARKKGWATAGDRDWEILRAAREIPPPDHQLDLLDIGISIKTPEPKADEATTDYIPHPSQGRRMRNKGRRNG